MTPAAGACRGGRSAATARLRALADRYGTGILGDLLRLYGGPDLAPWIEGQLEVERDAQDIFLDPLTGEPPYRVWPEPGGLLPWADTYDGIIFHWHTSDAPPERWPGIVERGDAPEPDFWAFDGTATELLLGIIDGSVDVPQLRRLDTGSGELESVIERAADVMGRAATTARGRRHREPGRTRARSVRPVNVYDQYGDVVARDAAARP